MHVKWFFILFLVLLDVSVRKGDATLHADEFLKMEQKTWRPSKFVKFTSV